VPDRAKLTIESDGKEQSIELPVLTGSEGEKALDIGQLRAKTGYVCLDPAFVNTASTTSAITFLDGEKGVLRYRGIPIEQLGEKSTFVETSYLLIYGHLPNRSELSRFSTLLTRHSLIHEDMKRFFDGYPTTAHPMAILSGTPSSSTSPSRACWPRCAPSPPSRTRSRSGNRSSTRRTPCRTRRTS